MEKIFAIAIAALSATPGAANTKFEVCMIVAEYAEVIMQTHQAGYPLARVLENTPETMLQEVAIEAFSRTRYTTPQYQQQAVAAFRDEMHVTCLRS